MQAAASHPAERCPLWQVIPGNGLDFHRTHEEGQKKVSPYPVAALMGPFTGFSLSDGMGQLRN